MSPNRFLIMLTLLACPERLGRGQALVDARHRIQRNRLPAPRRGLSSGSPAGWRVAARPMGDSRRVLLVPGQDRVWRPKVPIWWFQASRCRRGTLKTDPYLGTQEIYTQQVEGTVAYQSLRLRRPPLADQGDLPGLCRGGALLSPDHQGACPLSAAQPRRSPALSFLGGHRHRRRSPRVSAGRVVAPQGAHATAAGGMNRPADPRRRRPSGRHRRHVGRVADPIEPDDGSNRRGGTAVPSARPAPRRTAISRSNPLRSQRRSPTACLPSP